MIMHTDFHHLILHLYTKYLEGMRNISCAAPMSLEEFSLYASTRLKNMNVVYQMENNQCVGAIFYAHREEEGMVYCYVPVFGYFAKSEKVLGKLFQQLADLVVSGKRCKFIVHLYAHDEMSIRLFSMMQFGIMAEKGIRNVREIEEASHARYSIRTVTKEEIVNEWDTIWTLTKGIIDHLKTSPTFYPGNEFTEDVYRSFYLDEGTVVYGAFSEQDEMIGIIESNAEMDALALGSVKSVNVGEIYVMPEYRGTGLAEALLHYAENHEKARGAAHCWVEHGTANPNARGFWNKYFDTYQYVMVRDVEGIQR